MTETLPLKLEITEAKVSLLEKLTDDAVAIIVTIVVLAMAIMQIAVPDFLIAAFGLVLAFYFKK
jgi:hypothetical protein